MPGEDIHFCPYCEKWVKGRRKEANVCIRCEETANMHRCIRCGHTWWPRKNTLPNTCPRCKSPYWNKERVNKPKGVDI